MVEFLKIDRYILYLVITVAIIITFLPKIALIAFTILTLYSYFRSKNNLFWIVFFFTLILGVGGLFNASTSKLLSIGPIPVSIHLLFSLISFVKCLRLQLSAKGLSFNWSIKIWFLYLLFLLFLGYVIIGNSGGGKTGMRYFYSTLMFFPLLLNFYSLPRLVLSDISSLPRLVPILFTLVVINILGQIFFLVYGLSFTEYFNANASAFSDSAENDELLRPVFGGFICFLAILISAFYYLKTNKIFTNRYLVSIFFFSFISIFISATRGWIIAVVTIFTFILLIDKVHKIGKTFVIVLSLFALLLLSPVIRTQIKFSFDRLTTVGLILEGDLTAGGTNVRLTERSQPIMKLFQERPLFGWGFSDVGMEAKDVHVGNQNILMEGGVIGYLIIVLVWLNVIIDSITNHYHNKIKNRYYNNELLLIPFVLIGLIIIHSSSTVIFGYMIYTKASSNMLFIIVCLSLFNVLIAESKYSFNDVKGSTNH